MISFCFEIDLKHDQFLLEAFLVDILCIRCILRSCSLACFNARLDLKLPTSILTFGSSCDAQRWVSFHQNHGNKTPKMDPFELGFGEHILQDRNHQAWHPNWSTWKRSSWAQIPGDTMVWWISFGHHNCKLPPSRWDCAIWYYLLASILSYVSTNEINALWWYLSHQQASTRQGERFGHVWSPWPALCGLWVPFPSFSTFWLW